ncbi:fibronectin type III domain-containing protein [Paenibacillus oryzisoli]|uniref:glycoside hydrolase family 78 protein n=1 Tax=Paenibacillus oryzisoli TaxID=1850517 RepID=UPI003D2CA78E
MSASNQITLDFGNSPQLQVNGAYGVLSNGWIYIIRANPASSNRIEFWVSSDNGASFYLHTYIESGNWGLYNTTVSGTKLLSTRVSNGNWGNYYVYGIDLTAIPVGASANSVAYSNGGWWQQYFGYSYYADTGPAFLASNGKIYVGTTNRVDSGEDSPSEDKMWVGGWNTAFSAIGYGGANVRTMVEKDWRVYFVYPGVNVVSIDMNTNAFTPIGLPSGMAVNSLYYTYLLRNPKDGNIYFVDPYLIATLRIYKYDGSSWSQVSSFSFTHPSTETIVMDSSGNIHAFYYQAPGSMYHYTVSNFGTSVSAITDLGALFSTYNVAMQAQTIEGYSKGVGAAFASVTTTRVSIYSYTANTVPNAPTVTSPTAYANTRTPTISWTFSDPDSGDTQAGFEVEIANSAYNAVLWSSGYIASSATSYTIPAGAITSDGSYYFRMRVWDSSGAINIANGTSPDPNYGGRSTPTVIDTVAPNQPTHTIGTVTGTTAAITFSAFSDNVPSSGQNGGGYVCVETMASVRLQTNWLAVGQTSYTITGLTPNTQYRVFVVYQDNAGNWSLSSPVSTVSTDTTAPNSPTQTNGVLYATSNGVSWSAFNDPAPSSGLLLTTLYLQQWNGSSWANVLGYPKSVVGLTNSLTGLTPATQYRWGVTYMDNAGNVSTLNYTTFTTNSYPVSTSVNLSSSGYTLNKRPKFKFTVTDANDATLTNFQIQISAANDFSSILLDTTSSAVSSGWSATSLSSGSTGYYTPQADITTGPRYVRIRAYDGKDWGTWSGTAAFTIQAVSWPTVIASDDTAISKRTIDDLRTKINAIRQARGLAVATWTDASIQDWTNGASATNIRAVHLIELRQAITDIYTVLSTAAPSWAPDTVIDTTKDRKGQHWLDLRTALLGT